MDATRATTTQQQAIATLLTVHAHIESIWCPGTSQWVTDECHKISRADRRTVEVSMSK